MILNIVHDIIFTFFLIYFVPDLEVSYPSVIKPWVLMKGDLMNREFLPVRKKEKKNLGLLSWKNVGRIVGSRILTNLISTSCCVGMSGWGVGGLVMERCRQVGHRKPEPSPLGIVWKKPQGPGESPAFTLAPCPIREHNIRVSVILGLSDSPASSVPVHTVDIPESGCEVPSRGSWTKPCIRSCNIHLCAGKDVSCGRSTLFWRTRDPVRLNRQYAGLRATASPAVPQEI